MTEIKVHDVRVLQGDSAFLIDDGDTSILYDTGFGFTGKKIADNIEKVLDKRKLDYILLTHSHYDHALASVKICEKYPEAKIFSLTTGAAVMKMNFELGYRPVTFDQLTTDPAFWKGCESCVNYDILQRNGGHK